MKFFLLILTLLLTGHFFGQEYMLKGSIYDYATGNPIEKAAIEIVNNTQSVQTIYSDAKGIFGTSLNEGTYNIFISKEGYKGFASNVTLSTDKTVPIIFLEPNDINLEEVVLSVRKKNIDINNEGITLKIDDSPFFQGASFSDVLNIVPGVVASQNNIIVLGKSRILYLLNGRKTNITISDIPINNVESIKVISSPSAKYDAQYDVVIDLTLKKWAIEGWSGGINTSNTATFNNNFSTTANTYLNYNKNKFNLSTYFALDNNESTTFSNGFQQLQTVIQNQVSENDGERFSQYAYLNINYDIAKKSKIGFEIDYLNRDSESSDIVQSSFTEINESSIDSVFSSTSLGVSDGYNYSLGGFFNHKTENNELNISVKYFENSNLNNRVFNFNEISSPSVTFEQITDNDTRSATFVSSLDYTKIINDKNFIELGLRSTFFDGSFDLLIDVNETFLDRTIFDFKENIYAAYAIWNFQLKKFSFNTGIRNEFFTRDVLINTQDEFKLNNFNFFPSLSVDYSPNKKHYFKFAFSKKIKRPSFNQITPFEFFTSFNTRFLGNPSIKNQISNNFELTYFLNRKYSFNLYYNKDNDLIENTGVIDDDFITINQAINYDYATLGFQFGFRHKITNWLTSIQKVTLERVVSDGVLLESPFNQKSFEALFYFAEVINLKKKGNITLVGNYSTPNFYDIYRVDQGFKLDARYSLRLFKNSLTASVTFRDVLGTYFNEIRSSFVNQNSFFDKDINVREVSFNLSYNFSKGRDKDINTGTNIDQEKKRIIN